MLSSTSPVKGSHATDATGAKGTRGLGEHKRGDARKWMEGETTVILRQRDAERQREPIGELRMRSGPVLEQYRDTR